MSSALEAQHHKVEKTEASHAQNSLTEHLHASAKSDSGTEGHLKSAQQSAHMVEKGTLPPCEVAHCGNDTKTPKSHEDHHPGAKTDGKADNHQAHLSHHESQKHADKHHHHHNPDHHNSHHKSAEYEGSHHGEHKPHHHEGKHAPGNSDAVHGSNNRAVEPGKQKDGAPEACGEHGAEGKQDFNRMLQRSGIEGDDASRGKTKGPGGDQSANSTTQHSDGSSLTDGRAVNGKTAPTDGRIAPDGGSQGMNSVTDGRSDLQPKSGQPTDGRVGSFHNQTDRINQEGSKFKAGAVGDSPEKGKSELPLGSKGDSPDPAWLKSRPNISGGKGVEMNSSQGPDSTQISQNFKVVFPNAMA